MAYYTSTYGGVIDQSKTSRWDESNSLAACLSYYTSYSWHHLYSYRHHCYNSRDLIHLHSFWIYFHSPASISIHLSREACMLMWYSCTITSSSMQVFGIYFYSWFLLGYRGWSIHPNDWIWASSTAMPLRLGVYILVINSFRSRCMHAYAKMPR